MKRTARPKSFFGSNMTRNLILVVVSGLMSVPIVQVFWLGYRLPPTSTTPHNPLGKSNSLQGGVSTVENSHLPKESRAGHDLMENFQPISRTTALEDQYLTLWLHQVHRWFRWSADNADSSKQQIRGFLQQAKDAGFTSIMGDIPWEWTEREGENDIRLGTFGKDWMGLACELGLKLHVVATMRELPPWVSQNANESFFDRGRCIERPNDEIAGTPSVANPTIWRLAQQFTRNVTKALIQEYGTCIQSVSPTLNNEFETRFVQTRDMMRDHSPSAMELYRQWQVEKGYVTSESQALKPPLLPCFGFCKPVVQESSTRFLGFREEFLAERYTTLCRGIKESAVEVETTTGGKVLHRAECLLHFGEMFATTDILHSNIFFDLAKSPHVDHLVMDSNMALSGAPSSPSIVGVLVSTAQSYGKQIHYEAATERILTCDDNGKSIHGEEDVEGKWEEGGHLLLKTGITHALEAGVQSLGLTNLCEPRLAGQLFESVQVPSKNRGNAKDVNVLAASAFQPTAVIFVPYRAFFAFKAITSGVTCDAKPTTCWHPSFASMPFFGAAKRAQGQGHCPTDVAQSALLTLWDELRTRHAHVSVIGDVERLTAGILQGATERVLLQIPCVMESHHWSFYEGAAIHQKYRAISKEFSFVDHVDQNLNSFADCSKTI